MVAAVFVAQALGIAQLPLLARVGTLVPFIVLQGAANGMATLARATSLARSSARAITVAISGAVALGANGARAVGPVGASLLLLGLGSYPAVFWALAASLVAAACRVLFADRSTAPTTDYAGRILASGPRMAAGRDAYRAAVHGAATPRLGSSRARPGTFVAPMGVGCTGPNTRSSRPFSLFC